eukprot:1302360-Amphidinium_carterae.1
MLCLESKTLKPPKEDKESVQDALNQHLEASLLRLGECPPTAQAQREFLEGRISARKTQKAKDSRKAWQTFVKEAWEETPRKIYKWLRGKTLVWNLAVSLDGKWAAGPAEVAELEVQAWNKLWQGDPVTQARPRTAPSGLKAL